MGDGKKGPESRNDKYKTFKMRGMHGVAVATHPWSLGKPEVLGSNPSQAVGGLVGIT